MDFGEFPTPKSLFLSLFFTLSLHRVASLSYLSTLVHHLFFVLALPHPVTPTQLTLQANSWYYAIQGITDGKQYDDFDLDKSKVFALAESLRMTEGHAAQFSLGPGAPLRTADLDRIIKIATNTCGTAEFIGWDGEVGGREHHSGDDMVEVLRVGVV